MKKAFIVVAVLALTMVSSVALADISISGSVDFRGRATNNRDNKENDGTVARDSTRFNESRVSLTADGKMGDAKAKITIWTDWETFGNLETSNNNMSVKEAWADFPLFGIFRAKYGHMPLMLGNGWFFRHMYRGDDAWVFYGDAGGAHFGLVNVKITEAAPDNDSDIYALVFTQKAGDSLFGVNLSRVVFVKPSALVGSKVVNNIGAHATVAAGPAKLNVEFDMQMGKDKTVVITPASGVGANPEYKGNQLVIQGTLPMGAATLNFTVGRGTGNKTPDINGVATSTDIDQIQTYLDITNKPQYTFFYDYLLKTAAGAQNTGFANTTAVGVGADVKIGKATVGGSAWLLKATEKTRLNGANDIMGNPVYSDDLGMEIDAMVKLPMADTVTATLYGAYFMPGEAYSYNHPVTGLVTDGAEGTALMLIITAGLK